MAQQWISGSNLYLELTATEQPDGSLTPVKSAHQEPSPDWQGMVLEHFRKLTYREWIFHLTFDPVPLFWISFLAPDPAQSHRVQTQVCRKWYLDPSKPADEFVGTAWLAVQTAEMHEAREFFQYAGLPIFTPHVPLSQRVEEAHRWKLKT